MSTSTLRVGMYAPGEPILFELSAPAGVDFTSGSPDSLAVTLLPPTGSPVVLSDFSYTTVSASKLRATYLPDGSEITVSGQWYVEATLTFGGNSYAYPRKALRARDP